MEKHLCLTCKKNNNCDIQKRNKDIKQMIACVSYDELPQCELCGSEWFDITSENLIDDNLSIKHNKRCISCYEEWGDNYPDRV